MLIRTARPHELDEVGEITASAYTSDGHLPPTSPYVDDLRDARSRAAGAMLLVAVEDDEGPVLGTVTFCLAGTPYADLAHDAEAEFRMLAVAAGARRRGIGTHLVGRCVELAREAGSSALVLSSMQTMHTAHAIYRRYGFQRVPERDWAPTPDVLLAVFVLPLQDQR